MNKLASHSFLTILLLAAAGCSQRENPLESNTSPATATAEKPEWVKAAEAQGLELIYLPHNPDQSLKKQVSVTRLATVRDTTKIRVGYNYVTSNSRNVNVDATLSVLPGALNQDQYLTMTVDDVALATWVDLTFGPHGTNFNKPALLNIDAKGLDLSSWSRYSTVYLYYYNPTTGKWEQMTADRIRFSVNSGQLQCVNGKLPHFSRYAFGRVSTN